MDSIKAMVTPANQGDWQRRGRVQVTTVVGGRPVTVHLLRKQGRWMAPNPDKVAVARLDAAEKVETTASAIVVFFETKMALAEGAISILKDMRQDGEVDSREYANARRQAGRLHKLTSAKLAEAQGILEVAKKVADEVRATVSREVEFVF